MGDPVDGSAGRRDRGRLQEPRKSRPRAGDLHVRGDLRHVGRGLSLQRMAGKTADSPLLGTWMAARAQRAAFGSSITIIRTSATHLVGQRFIHRRSALRWWMHQCIFWGCLLAMAITFPLVFGWIAFRSRPDDQMIYVTYLFGFPAGEFRIRTVVSSLLFHGLDIAAVLVLAGIGLSLWRRMRDQGAQSLQSFAMDFFPLTILFAISITGLALTVSQEWLRGAGYSFLVDSSRHHRRRRAAVFAVRKVLSYFPASRATGREAVSGSWGCRRRRLMRALRPALRFSNAHRRPATACCLKWDLTTGSRAAAEHWQALCPACKRKTLAGAQLRIKEQSRG